MSYPNNLLIVRHAESEGNVINAKLRHDSTVVADDKFLTTHNSGWKLTQEGQMQAELTGNWLRSEFGDSIEQCYVSPYTRTLQTARLLDLPSSKWNIDLLLREREAYGTDRPVSANKDAIDSYDFMYLAPLGVETFAQLYQRVELFMHKLEYRSGRNNTSVIVTHGKIIWVLRMYLEKMLPHQIIKTFPPRKAIDKIKYCHVLHYTDASESGYLKYRSITPYMESEVSHWNDLTFVQSYSNEELDMVLAQLD